MNETSGLKSSAPLPSSDPATPSSKTSPASPPSDRATFRSIDAYAAGLVDGEGCLYIDPALRPVLQVGMAIKARPTLERLGREYGGRFRTASKGNESWSEEFRWTVRGREVVAMLERIGPYLRLKQEHARLLLLADEINRSLPKRGRSKWTPEARERVETLRRRVQELNRRGPPDPPMEEGAIALLVAGQWVAPQLNLLSDLGYTSFSEGWPRSAIQRHGVVYELPTWARLTDETDGSASPGSPTTATREAPMMLLPSPSASESTPTDEYVAELREHLDPDDPHHRLWLPGRRWMAQRTLSRTAAALLPTPSASDSTGAEGETRRLRQLTGKTGGGSLRDLPRILEAPADADRGRREQHDEGERRVPLPRPRDTPHRLIPTTPTESDADSSSGRDPAWGHGLTLTDFARGAREDTRRLLPTPTAEDGERGRGGAGSDRLGAATFDDPGDVRLLPTPQAADGDGGRMEKGAMRRGGKRPSGHKGTLTLGTAVDLREEIAERPFAAVAEGEQAALFAADAVEVALLPTPVANPENPGAGGDLRAAVVHGEGRRNETGVDTLGRPNRGRPSRLLPTPTTQDGENTAGPSQRRRHSDPLNVVAADALLPTPQAADGDRSSEQMPRHYSTGADNPTLLGAARRAEVEWGVYEGAVRRWEEVSGQPAPAPTDEKGRLDPPFVTWMLGYPEGWFDVPDVSRTAKLRALGNSVQVQVGEVVGLWLAGLVDSGLLS
jgi:hypothetical protein